MANEYTQSFSYSAASTGPTGIQYFALNASTPPTGSVYILKSCYVSCPTGFTSVASTTPAVLCYTSDDNIGTNQKIFSSYNPGTISSALEIFTALEATSSAAQLISTQEYIGINVNFTNALSTFYVVVTYIVIPGGNVVAGTFLAATGTIGVGIGNIVNVSSTNVRFLKSIHFVNNITNTSTFTIQMCALNQAGTTIEGYLNFNQAITGFQTATFSSPFYMAPNSLVCPGYSITSSGGGTLSYYCSYCQV